MKFEDLKDIARVPYEDRCKFIDLVYFDKYVLGALGHPEDADVTLTPQVGSITRCVISNNKHVLIYIYIYIYRHSVMASRRRCPSTREPLPRASTSIS